MSDITLSPVLGPGPEDVLPLGDGRVLTGLEDGRIVCVAAGFDRFEEIAHTGGRPLGLEPMPDGRVLICDARRGLLALDLGTGDLEDLTPDAPPFCNNAAVGDDGTIYFSSSSTRHPIEASTTDIVERRPTGSLWMRAPDGACRRLVDGLCFANGVVLAPDASHVLVAETGAARVQRHWLSGPQAGTTQPLLSDLAGLPDNLTLGTDGHVWMALVAPADTARRVWALPTPLRWLAARLPVGGTPARRLHVMAFDFDGRVQRQIDLLDAPYHFVTGVRQAHGTLLLGSVRESRIARLELT